MKVVYLVTEDWYFYSHRFALARAVMVAGHEVTVVTKVTNHGEVIRNAGMNLVHVDFQRSAGFPLKDIFLFFKLIRLYRKLQPELVHHVALKPVIFGSIAASITKVPVVINALTGLGYVFSSNEKRAKLFRLIIRPLLSLFLNRRNTWTIFQNSDDLELLSAQGIKTGQSVLIQGSGVDITAFVPFSEPEGDSVIVLASRMLKDKGIGEFVEAASLCREQHITTRFVLVGDIDRENPMTVTREQLHDWQAQGVIEWWGHREDMVGVFRQAHIVCLPSYREGLPKVLLEAAAAGRPIVATDVPGCREIVRHGENGWLVPVKNPERLAQALNKLIENKQLRHTMGMKGRALVEQKFAMEMVNEQTLALYRRAINDPGNNKVALN